MPRKWTCGSFSACSTELIGPARDAGLLECLQQVTGRPVQERFGQDGVQLVAVADAF